VVALDLTRPMLEVAQKEAEVRKLPNIHFLEGDAQSLPCEDASFDVVVCRQAAHHFPNVWQCVSEWARVLKPGGKLLLIDSVSPEEQEVDAFLEQVEILRDPSHVRNQRISQWNALLNDAGFAVEQARSWGILLDIDSWTQRMRTPPAAVATIEGLLRAAGPAIRTRLQIELRDDGTFVFVLPAVLVVAIFPV
jgi:SAM-dependent methyltransferase